MQWILEREADGEQGEPRKNMRRRQRHNKTQGRGQAIIITWKSENNSKEENTMRMTGMYNGSKRGAASCQLGEAEARMTSVKARHGWGGSGEGVARH